METNTGEVVRQSQIRVCFITDTPDIQLPEEKRQLLVPTSEIDSAFPKGPRRLQYTDLQHQTFGDMDSLRFSIPSLCSIHLLLSPSIS